MKPALGLDEDALPVGLQAVGTYWSESSLIHCVQLTSRSKTEFVMPSEEYAA